MQAYLLQVEERASAAGAGHVLCLGVAHAAALQEAEGCSAQVVQVLATLQQDAIAKTIYLQEKMRSSGTFASMQKYTLDDSNRDVVFDPMLQRLHRHAV